ncbi:MAG TPA: hypothetical protein VFH08_06905 [Chitinophagaceae bacterium]|nr:hypothetical protein [Chitinophagaceae bacterium]
MIKFEPGLLTTVHSSNPEMISLRNSSIYQHASELNNKYMDVSCRIHPDIESKILVRLRDEDDFLEIQSWCCADFKSQLDKIVQEETRGPNSTER